MGPLWAFRQRSGVSPSGRYAPQRGERRGGAYIASRYILRTSLLRRLWSVPKGDGEKPEGPLWPLWAPPGFQTEKPFSKTPLWGRGSRAARRGAKRRLASSAIYAQRALAVFGDGENQRGAQERRTARAHYIRLSRFAFGEADDTKWDAIYAQRALAVFGDALRAYIAKRPPKGRKPLLCLLSHIILRPFLAKQDSPLGTLCPKGTSKAAPEGAKADKEALSDRDVRKQRIILRPASPFFLAQQDAIYCGPRRGESSALYSSALVRPLWGRPPGIYSKAAPEGAKAALWAYIVGVSSSPLGSVAPSAIYYVPLAPSFLRSPSVLSVPKGERSPFGHI